MHTAQDWNRDSSYLASVMRSVVDLWHSMHAPEFLNLISFSVCRQLDHNNLTEVTKGWLYGLLMLQQLHLSQNAISRISPDAWEFCQKLSELWVPLFSSIPGTCQNISVLTLTCEFFIANFPRLLRLCCRQLQTVIWKLYWKLTEIAPFHCSSCTKAVTQEFSNERN